ncbi:MULTISPECIES: DUF4174 domain-containing protein [Microbulbifer]|uniref:DUF4174 domain-containing protein n=1 Tax=Microbulbifer TaxID=48073 RepID=UPI0007462860|nr:MULTISPECIES: DUF4174 domain-containing protein [Microbulbifer]KUJ80268.1 hypothetical protein AVO43_14735 [Microbulbifer sp. ZGT114]
MKSLVFTTLCLLLAQAGNAEDEGMENLSPLQWQNRILLVRSPKAAPDAEHQLRAAETAISERHLLWFLITAEGIRTNHAGTVSKQFTPNILERYFADQGTNVVLIGKDGGVKARARSLDLEAIFSLIDSMPMRREEMRRQAE